MKLVIYRGKDIYLKVDIHDRGKVYRKKMDRGNFYVFDNLAGSRKKDKLWN